MQWQSAISYQRSEHQRFSIPKVRLLEKDNMAHGRRHDDERQSCHGWNDPRIDDSHDGDGKDQNDDEGYEKVVIVLLPRLVSNDFQ